MLTRKEQLTYCTVCTNKSMDMQRGIVCKLTDAYATFEKECESYEKDLNVRIENSDLVFQGSEINQVLGDEEIQVYRLEQNLILGSLGAICIGILGAILWGIITVVTGFQIGYMALAIGAGVGFGMQYFGKGIDPIFGYTGGLVALLSCILGNAFSIIGYVANLEDLGYMETMILFDYSMMLEILIEAFTPIDLVFYGIAIYEGYKFSFRKFNQHEVSAIKFKR